MERAFQIIAVVLAGIAAFLLYSGNKDAAFVTIVFGCIAFFFSVRTQSKVRVEKENAAIIAQKYGDDPDEIDFDHGGNLDTEFEMRGDRETVDKAKSGEFRPDI